MTTDILTTGIFANLEAIRQFLTEDVAAQVPPQLRAEVRAASKCLLDIAREIDALPALLLAECTAMLEICEQAVAGAPRLERPLEIAHLRQQLALPMASLSGQIRLHDALKGAIELILIEMSRNFDNAPAGSGERAALGQRMQAIYRLLAKQADARMSWQSVFPALPASPPPSTMD